MRHRGKIQPAPSKASSTLPSDRFLPHGGQSHRGVLPMSVAGPLGSERLYKTHKRRTAKSIAVPILREAQDFMASAVET
eukprot:6476008-Amphidinium_carterae.1